MRLLRVKVRRSLAAPCLLECLLSKDSPLGCSLLEPKWRPCCEKAVTVEGPCVGAPRHYLQPLSHHCSYPRHLSEKVSRWFQRSATGVTPPTCVPTTEAPQAVEQRQAIPNVPCSDFWCRTYEHNKNDCYVMPLSMMCFIVIDNQNKFKE